MLIVGIAGMVASVLMFILGFYGGRRYEHETAMDAARNVILRHELSVLEKLEGIVPCATE